jgi:hypothetical protein
MPRRPGALETGALGLLQGIGKGVSRLGME